jgi:hypothetical protein
MNMVPLSTSGIFSQKKSAKDEDGHVDVLLKPRVYIYWCNVNPVPLTLLPE